jgi:hypothetical protein
MEISEIIDTDDSFKYGFAIILDREELKDRSLRQIYLNWLHEIETI